MFVCGLLDKIFHTGSMKKLVVETTIYENWPRRQLQCKQCRFVRRSLSDQFSFSLAIFDWSPQKTLMLNVQPSNLSICAPAKIAWGWVCWTVKTFCCVVVEVLTWFSSDWADVPGSRFRVQTFLAVASEMLNASCRAFSNFCDRLAVQRSLAERLLREVVQHWSF